MKKNELKVSFTSRLLLDGCWVLNFAVEIFQLGLLFVDDQTVGFCIIIIIAGKMDFCRGFFSIFVCPSIDWAFFISFKMKSPFMHLGIWSPAAAVIGRLVLT